MADTADQSRAASSEFAPQPPGGLAPPRRESVPALAPPPPPESIEGYRPLSLLAVIGFVLAIFYGLYIVGFTLLTFATGDFLYLQGWTILLPVAVAALCLLARRMVLRSEGTLGGERLASRGLAIAVVVGLLYWSYHAATFLAMRQQAVSFAATKFLPALVKGKIEEAFALTFQPPRPTPNRKFIESNLNVTPNRKLPGRFTLFTETEYSRLLEMAGDKAELTLKNTGVPFLNKGEMQVPIIYRVTTPVKSFDMQILALAVESRNKEAPGRQWRIDADHTGIVLDSSVYTPEGIRLTETIEPTARLFVSTWINKLTNAFDVEHDYRYTLTPARRAALGPKIQSKSEADLIKVAEKDPEVAEFLAGLNAFRKGSVVQTDKKGFFISDAVRDEALKEAQKRFLSGFASSDWMKMSDALPLWEHDGKKMRFIYDVHLQLLPKYVGDARIIVESDQDFLADPEAKPALESWQLMAMELVRATAAPSVLDKTKQPGSGD